MHLTPPHHVPAMSKYNKCNTFGTLTHANPISIPIVWWGYALYLIRRSLIAELLQHGFELRESMGTVAYQAEPRQARFPFERNRLLNENLYKRKRLRWQAANHGCQRKRMRFLRFSFTQRTQRKRLRFNGNRASLSASVITRYCVSVCEECAWRLKCFDTVACVTKVTRPVKAGLPI